MIRKTTAALVPLTLELAQYHSTMPALPGERERKPSRVQFFQDHIKHGTFGSPTWSIVTIKGSNEEYRIDGQHTSYALSLITPDAFPDDLFVTLQRFEIDSLSKDAERLFELFDNPKSARSNTDIMGLYSSQYPDLEGLSREFLVRVTNAIDYYLRDIRRKEPDETKWPMLFQARQHGIHLDDPGYREFARWLSQWLGAKNAWMMGKPALAAEMLAEWKLKPDLATSFWSYIFLNNHPDVSHETRELADQLNELRHKPRIRPEQFRIPTKKMWSRFRRMPSPPPPMPPPPASAPNDQPAA